MEKEKKIVLTVRIVTVLLIVASVIYCLIPYPKEIDISSKSAAVMLAIIIALMGFGCFNCKIREYDGKSIIVYSGILNHYIKVDGVKYDEEKTIMSLHTLYLSCDVGDLIEVKISTLNLISIKINGQLY